MKGKVISRGIIASKGKITGIVRVIISHREFSSFKEGEILVTEKTDPSFTLLINKAAGVITETGGIGSHASIVTREIGIPCIVSAKGITKKVKTGQKITLDAEDGCVYG